MQNSVYLNAAGALAAQNRMDVVANNIANVDTPGFRRGFSVFQQRLAEVWEAPELNPAWDKALNEQGGGLFVHQVTYSDDVGALKETGGELDLAIDGDGWFPVERDGSVFYTRGGNFTRSGDGSVVTASGQAKLLDFAGEPIVVPESISSISVEGNGTVRFDDAIVTRLQIRGALDHTQFTPIGDNLYRFLGSGQPDVANSTIRQKFLETSTVSPVTEMVNMIRTHRAYESNQRMIAQQDQVLARTVNDVGRIG